MHIKSANFSSKERVNKHDKCCFSGVSTFPPSIPLLLLILLCLPPLAFAA